MASTSAKILVNIDSIIQDVPRTYLTADIAEAGTAFTVRSNREFAANDLVLVGEIGTERAEILTVSSITSDDTVTTGATVFPHDSGDPMYLVQWNRIELSHATTATGSKTLLTVSGGSPASSLGSGLIAIRPEQHNTVYFDDEYSSGFYFARFSNSVTGDFSDYTDAIPYTGIPTNTLGHAMQYALKRNNLTGFTEIVDEKFCIDEANTCLKFIQGKQIRWPNHQEINQVLGQTVQGTFRYDLASNLSPDPYDIYTRKSIMNVRIGDETKPLTYLDPIDFEEQLKDTKYTQVTTAASSGNTTLAINNSYDFDDSGNVSVYVSGTKYTITYTGVTRSATAGVLTGIPASGTGSITVFIAANTYVFQDEDTGRPRYWTVRNGSLDIAPMPDSSYDNMNVYLDYWSVATEVDSDTDTLDTDRFDLVKLWLTAAIQDQIKFDGIRDMSRGYWIQFREGVSDAIRTKGVHYKHKIMPKINTISYGRRGTGVIRPLPESNA